MGNLARFAHLHREPDADQGWEIARSAWHTHGIVIANVGEIEKRAGWVAAKQARNLGEQLFGSRKGGR